jgi:hypothetical protein
MKSVFISVWADQPSAVREAKSLVPTLKGSEELHVDEWTIGERVSRHVRAFDTDYDPSDDDECEDTPVMV